MAEILYPDENPQVNRHSSIDQFGKYVSTWKQGGLAPIVFDQIDGITCGKIKSHKMIITWDPIGYAFPEGHCTYFSDKFVTVDKKGVEQVQLPECMGGTGEFFERWVDKKAFINFDNGTSLGVHNKKTLRVGLSYVTADKTLPAVD